MTHEIKIQKEYAQAVFLGEKTFEVRNNDRGYQKGDLVKFQVMDGVMKLPTHSLNYMTFEITYVLGSFAGLAPNYVAFAIRPFTSHHCETCEEYAGDGIVRETTSCMTLLQPAKLTGKESENGRNAD